MTNEPGSSQSNIANINPEKWSYSYIKSFSSVTLWTESWLDGSCSCAVTAFMTSSPNDHNKVVFSCWLMSFFLNLYLSLTLFKKFWWCQYLPRYPYLILLVGRPVMIVFQLGTYCCMFCCCKIYLWRWFCKFFALSFYCQICCCCYMYICIGSRVLSTCSIGLSSSQFWFH